MERKISLSDLRRVAEEAYEHVKNLPDGQADQRIECGDKKTFGISIVLTDGTIVNVGDTDVRMPMGDIVKIPVHEMLLTQRSVDDIIRMSGEGERCKGEKPRKPHGLGVSPHGIRAVSALEPKGDPDSKWNLMVDNLIDLMGGEAPVLDVRLYETLQAQNKTAGVKEAIENFGYTLYDDAGLSIDLYTRLTAMRASSAQLAMMGATIAADGVCPRGGNHVFDGSLSQTIVGMMAAMGPHRISKPWLVATGLPAKSGFGGGVFGVLPGIMGIGAVTPGLNGAGTSEKGTKAIAYIMNKLGLSVFSSAKVTILKD